MKSSMVFMNRSEKGACFIDSLSRKRAWSFLEVRRCLYKKWTLAVHLFFGFREKNKQIMLQISPRGFLCQALPVYERQISLL